MIKQTKKKSKQTLLHTALVVSRVPTLSFYCFTDSKLAKNSAFFLMREMASLFSLPQMWNLSCAFESYVQLVHLIMQNSTLFLVGYS
uniref:Uncharacterized protein n=1 Tax=Rhipicephalus appendiculatus TaxID=34631 RepID=A0A131YB62_RHIAP